MHRYSQGWIRRLRGMVCLTTVGLTVAAVTAQEPGAGSGRLDSRSSIKMSDADRTGRQYKEAVVHTGQVPVLRLIAGRPGQASVVPTLEPSGAVAGTGANCGALTYADPALFEGGELIIQSGFVEGETAYAVFEVDPSLFPLTIESVECMVAQKDTIVPTVTKWSFLIWDGPPIPGVGQMAVAPITSDDALFPHLRMAAGTEATIVRVDDDPNNPGQMTIYNNSGTNMFSVGFRIDKHNYILFHGCVLPAPESNNAFPVTDTDDLDNPDLEGNWLDALICDGPCDGLNTFGGLPVGLCRPSGDWMIRVNVACTLIGACCDVDAVCSDDVANTDCVEEGGTFWGDGSTCSQVTCDPPVGACCFGNSCLEGVNQVPCESLSEGVYMGNGSACADVSCELGACCMPDGSCLDLLDVQCAADGGSFQVASDCSSFSCPQPTGACCIEGSCFADQPFDVCEQVGVWQGGGSTCDPDPCAMPVCPDATIVSTEPPSATLDARQPHEPYDALVRQGIGSPSEPILIALGAPGAEACFELCETLPDGTLGDNDIFSVTDLGGGVYVIVLDWAIAPGGITMIRYLGDDSIVAYASQPGDTNADGQVTLDDIDFLEDVLNDDATPLMGHYSADVDRSGRTTPADLLRLIDLMTGAAQYDPRLGSSIVTTGCP